MWFGTFLHINWKRTQHRSCTSVHYYCMLWPSSSPVCCCPSVTRGSPVHGVCFNVPVQREWSGMFVCSTCAVVSRWFLLYLSHLKQFSGGIHQIFVSSSPAKCSQMFLKPTSGQEVTGACVLLQWDGFHPGSPFPRRTMRSCPVAALTSPVWPSGHQCPTLNGCWGRRIWPLKMTCPLGEMCWNSPTSDSRPTTRASPCQRWAL